MGAWIEISTMDTLEIIAKVAPLWECGLKYAVNCTLTNLILVAPVRNVD